jgi:thiol-disulfide isomerase/thioredoxin
MNSIAAKPITGFFCAVLLLLLLEAGAALLLVSSVGSTDDAPALPRMTRLSDLQGTFSDLSGQSFSLADLRGKVVVINLWATWCPPCRAEMPFLEGLWKKFQDNDRVRVLCISKETLAEVRKDPLAESLSMPLYVFTSPVPPELDPEGLPTTYIFDREGRVVFGHTGIAQWDSPEIVAYLEALAQATAN